MNSLRNKYEFLVEIVKGNVDISLISKTILDKNFPTGQYKIERFDTFQNY